MGKKGIVVIFFILLNNLWSDASYYYDKDGVCVLPLKSENIVLKKEIVRIKYDFKRKKWIADCEFIFFNKGNKEKDILMGYPDWLNYKFDVDTQMDEEKQFKLWDFFIAFSESLGYKPDMTEAEIYFLAYKRGILPYMRSAWKVHDLEVEIEGKRVDMKHRPIDTKMDVKKIYLKEEIPGKFFKPLGAFVWKVNFKPYETKKVKVSFSFSGFFETSEGRELTYILTTGSRWADSIEIADIYWDIKGIPVDTTRILPKNFEIKDSVLHWHFENFEPRENITVFIRHF